MKKIKKIASIILILTMLVGVFGFSAAPAVSAVIVFPDPVYDLGDLNKDSSVDHTDLIIMKRYFADWDIQVDEDLLDVDQQNGFDMLDIIYLSRYLASWNDYPKPERIAKKYIGLSFDDGPSHTTQEILKILKKYNSSATFFVVGNNIDNQWWPFGPGSNTASRNVMKQVVNEGHEIGNHSYTHSESYANASKDAIAENVQRLQDIVTETTGQTPTVFRPPHLRINSTVYSVLQEKGLTAIQGIGCDDWKESMTAQDIATAMISKAQDGMITLLHDAESPNNNANQRILGALEIMIPALQAQGYEFVTISELFEIKGVTPKVNTLYDYVN